MRKVMVLGLLFDEACEEVALIRKQRPDWQRGLLNGIGGKAELDEEPLHALIREFKEETGVSVEWWKHFATMQGDDWVVECFKATSTTALRAVRTVTDEEVCVVPVNTLHNQRRMRNLNLLVSLALDRSGLACAPTLTY